MFGDLIGDTMNRVMALDFGDARIGKRFAVYCRTCKTQCGGRDCFWASYQYGWYGGGQSAKDKGICG